ncbi:hypothetical protein HYPSUDRAFT_133215 [Hypholoma sublateritium FD-334 SS-4]|uniref:BZIP domain-containing protein n=1 Tax=Hypholoma sublateritium (strain FD-334 SS-4) TaxID=945553 RepID=A0A0D2LFF5_HYPSF|nr:hypothetical protein HYPSUDRAFT_133215 [Hypholoma sublateritium FD-334 SS-4]
MSLSNSTTPSKRGRKRNDNLPPNRARDVQRAFRARRAAHLHALEQRVAELEEENNCLRLALRLPPSSRVPLGKGPTGKDKNKTYEGSNSQSLGFNSGCGSSDGNSPASRASSMSPSGIGVSMSSSSHPMTVIDGNWDDSLLLNDHQHPTQHTGEMDSSSDMPYHMNSMTTPMTAPMAVKPLQFPYNNTFATSSRSLSTNLYAGSPGSYTNSSARPMGASYNGHPFSRGDMREESRQQYTYSQPFASHESSGVHYSQTPSPGLHAHAQSQTLQPARESPLPFAPPHRRSVTEPQPGYSIGQGFPHLPHPAQPQQQQQQQQSRSSEHLRPMDGHSIQNGQASRSAVYSSDLP